MRRDKAIKYMKLAFFQADTFSKDPSTKVGCVILAPETYQVLSLGYNGMPRGFDETKPERWQRPAKYKYVEHAERNAIYNACRRGTPLENSIALVTMFPCIDCTRGLIQSGIHTIVTIRPDMNNKQWADSFQTSMEMIEEVGLDLIILEKEEIFGEC